MSQSVKLKDGSYIDASGVYDATQGSDFESLHEQMSTVVTTPWYTLTPTTLNTWNADTANALTLSKGTYIIRIYAYSSKDTDEYMVMMLNPLGEGTVFGGTDNAANPNRRGIYVGLHRVDEDTTVDFRIYEKISLVPIVYRISYIKLTN